MATGDAYMSNTVCSHAATTTHYPCFITPVAMHANTSRDENMMHADRTSIMYEGSAWDIPNAPVHTTRPEHLTCQRPQCAHITFEPKGCRCRKELQAPRRPPRESNNQCLQEPVPSLAVQGYSSTPFSAHRATKAAGTVCPSRATGNTIRLQGLPNLWQHPDQ